jgi:RHS repeat-associated protein
VTGAFAVAPAGGTTTPLYSALLYRPFGPASALTYGNGIAETRTYDEDYRATKIASAIQSFNYGWNETNTLKGLTDGLTTGNSQTFSYDVLSRLVGASGPYGALSYSYDANGNRTSETSAAVSDGLGAITAFTYNQEGRLSGAASGSQLLAQYTYDAFGQRAARTNTASGTTLYQYGLGNLLEETDGQGNAQVDYIYLGSRPVATIEPGGAFHFLHTDLLGTPIAASGSNQSVAWSTTYQPFGAIGTAPSTIVQNLRFPGQESDVSTGLYHDGMRDYVPATGQYIESDPLGLWGGLNRYAYAEGDPLVLTDPTGTNSVSNAWNQAQTFCDMGASCSFMDKAKMALNVLTAPTTPYQPPTPPPPPPEYFNPDGTLTSFGQAVMWCGAIVKGGGSTSQCSPQAAPIVNAAFVQQGLDQLSQLDQSFVNQVLYPTLENTVSDVGDVLTVWNAGTPYGTELTEGAETVIDFIEGYTQGTESVNPVPSSNSLAQLIGIETKDLLQALGVVPICPKAAAAAAAGN